MIDNLTVRQTLDARVREKTYYAGFLASLALGFALGTYVVPMAGLLIASWAAVLDALRARRDRDRYVNAESIATARVIARRSDPLNIDFH